MKDTGDRNFELRCACNTVTWMLKDYFHKLETDDRDFAAVEKMKEVKTALRDIELIRQASLSGKLTWN